MSKLLPLIAAIIILSCSEHDVIQNKNGLPLDKMNSDLKTFIQKNGNLVSINKLNAELGEIFEKYGIQNQSSFKNNEKPLNRNNLRACDGWVTDIEIVEEGCSDGVCNYGYVIKYDDGSASLRGWTRSFQNGRSNCVGGDVVCYE
ncbi:MAG: hypothetical protein ACKOE6_09425 [Flammeovirgaceae bacterium]